MILSVPVGQIREIYRYPVKSFAGESLEACLIERYGLYGDRFCAFVDEAREGWDSFITARDIPRMLAYRAQLTEEGICVTSPSGHIFRWNEQLLEEMQSFSRKKMFMTSYRAPNPENPDLMSVDAASIHIVTDSSLRRLEALWGRRLDHRRFRANLVVSIDDGTMDESDWIGKELRLGGAVLQIQSFCERCSVITIHPDTLERDASLLKRVYEEMDVSFGLYAGVKQPGPIRVGQKVYLSL
jgi:uncharacterized protein